MRGELLNLEHCDPVKSQQIRREIIRIASSTKACLDDPDPDSRFKLATALFIQQKSGYVPIGRDEHGIMVPGMRVMSQMVDIIATHEEGDLKAKLKAVMDEALYQRDWVWKNPLFG